jgi:hypothetical protein
MSEAMCVHPTSHPSVAFGDFMKGRTFVHLLLQPSSGDLRAIAVTCST